ncbi:hypothetical protein M409DRAFT_26915 [Zasmidium cellare ATCC 36951]|uniref:Uncharacterized protein n=1 Tax=Zasmidium cellare ATCC 36951 TaxID=1080233 RepID=A0A6A6C8U7_ZASCE|nr:uncharacterized protein M409DRAFT_26915 [Zasmidium cellare ATCC 36951]KAF2162678.1 hypothetical protein M409DRAFT_26915 [Zasmidium cellare ATCC 36951]
MSQNVAPWLAGLDDDVDWEDTPTQTVNSISSASHDASSLRQSSTRNPHRSPSGLPASLRTSSTASTQKRRSPLATLSNSNNNSLRRPEGSAKLAQSRSFSGAGSDDSVIEHGTVQQRSKSASPAKTQGTMEWKKRLLRGEVGYGDHTDLFGPSGLENIFQQSRPTENTPRKTRSSMSWLDKSSVMPSSPPPWPTKGGRTEPISEEEDEGDEQESFGQDRLTTVDEERESRETGQILDDSFRSNPFDLGHSEELQIEDSEDEGEQHIGEDQQSSPDRPLVEQTQDNIVGNRTVSGQTDLDDFSPVFISKHTTMNGRVEYKALDSRIVKQFRRRTVDLRHPSQEDQSSNTASDYEEPSAVEASTFTDGPESGALPAVPDLSLSENLPTGTPPVSSLGKHVQLKRGGYSAEGSFKEKPLSSSQSHADLSPVRESSGFLSPSVAADRNYPPAPSPPDGPATPGNKERSEPRSRSSGSPLKLFGPHDTFTSNRLLRRMSQLDPDLSQIRSEDVSDAAAHSPFEVEDNDTGRKVSNNSFGSGQLNGHTFNAEITITSASDSNRTDSDRSPGSEVPPPGSKTPLGFRLEDLPLASDTFKLKRKLSKRSDIASKNNSLESAPRHLQPTVEDASEVKAVEIEDRALNSLHGAGKRPPNSPFKAPTPKRRRTLHADDMQPSSSELARSYHSQLQDALSSRKRRESRQDHLHDIADPEILSQRKILRPRNPTPSQQRREELEAQIRETAEQFATQERETMEAVLEQLESSMASDTPPSVQQQANVVASEVAKFSLRIQKASGEHTERKRSVTTQDFFNEAVMVMRLIREKAGRQSGLGSVAESEQEAVSEVLEGDQSGQDLSSLRVSRPPSREGGSKWRPRTSEQTDARVISHLRKFQEKDDTEFIAQSIASLHVDDEDEQMVVVDEHSNIRIKGPLPTFHQTEDDPSRPSTQHSQQSSLASQSTQDSGASSTGRTLISRKSDNVGCLGPDAVAHLIGEQVGAMTYDKDKQQWAKAKSPKKPNYGSFLEPPSNITSDDDPFREISDLPVDERKEEEIRKASSTGRRLSVQPTAEEEEVPVEDQESIEELQESRIPSQETVLARPTTRDSNKSRHTYTSSDPSRWTGFASSQQQTVETRATSWGDEELQRLATQENARKQPLAYAAAQAALALAESNQGTAAAQHQTEEMITSCPTAPSHTLAPDRIEDVTEGDLIEESLPEESEVLAELQDDTVAGLDQSGVELLQSPKLRQSPTKTQFAPSSAYRGAARQMSLRRKTLTSRFNDPDAMEQSEVSFVAALPGERMMSVSLSVSRPVSKRRPQGHVAEAPSSPTKYDPSFMWSDLPEFTVHEQDGERPSERALVERLAQHAAAETTDRYALSIKDMVKTLTDVKEDEPRWDQLKQLDLHDRALSSLYGLDEFCDRIQDMDASHNSLLYLNGAPASLRQLVARSNQLSSLTSWSHLMNLQYLDISGNRLDDLDGLGCLFHLRELRADDNQIASVDGIMQLDGLLKLRLRRNKVQIAEFENSQLHRLENLDLCGNSITSLRGIESLPALESLNLDSNSLAAFPNIEKDMPRLKQLSLNHCRLQRLSVSQMPCLQSLLLDGNSLTTIEGIGKLKYLDVLSMRKQSVVEGLDIMILEQDLHARTVRLSGNDIPSLRLSKSLLSVKHLEIASAGLQELPGDFGLMLPNVTTLNLNFNSLKDVRPLLNIQKLQHLSVCGNRLARLRKTLATLSKLCTLKSVDLRDNPVTQGFYAPHTCIEPQTSVVRRSRPETEDEDEDIAAEKLEAARYTLPPGDATQDGIHHARLDEDTKLRRRVYHLLLGNVCKSLERVDGLAFDKTGAMARDKTWDRLVELGVVRRTGGMRLKGEGEGS